jgi:hypothetical protein
MLQCSGWTAVAQADWEAARTFFEEAVPLFREIGMPGIAGNCLIGLADVEFGRGEYERALARCRENFSGALRAGSRDMIGHVGQLWRIGRCSILLGDQERGVRLLGAVEVMRPACGRRISPADREFDDRILATARETMGEAAFAAAWAEGLALSFEEATALALQVETAAAPNRGA